MAGAEVVAGCDPAKWLLVTASKGACLAAKEDTCVSAAADDKFPSQYVAGAGTKGTSDKVGKTIENTGKCASSEACTGAKAGFNVGSPFLGVCGLASIGEAKDKTECAKHHDVGDDVVYDKTKGICECDKAKWEKGEQWAGHSARCVKITK